MNICLSHWSALECWRGIRRLGADYLYDILTTPPTSSSLPFRPSITSYEAVEISGRYCLSAPIEAAVLEHRHNRCTKQLVCKESGSIALRRHIIEIEPGLYLPEPELCFLLLSRELTLLELIWLGYEMTSTFALEGCSTGKRLDSLPLFKIDDCLQLALSSEKYGNKTKALRALKYVKPHADSPAEIELSMKLGLPFCYGGEGLGDHELNPDLPMSLESLELLDKKSCRGDLVFRGAKLDLEYQSAEWHTGIEKALEDDLRRNMLVREGYRVVFVLPRQLRDIAGMRELAQSVYRKLGNYRRVQSRKYAKRQAELFKLFCSGTSLVEKRQSRNKAC